MIDTTGKALLSRIASFASPASLLKGGFGGFGQDQTPPTALVWLAGAGYRPRKNTKSLQPAAKRDVETVDQILATPRPAKPVEAAAQRLALLKQLRRDAREEPRTKLIFEADQVIVEDTDSEHFVTETMLAARLRLFMMLDRLFEELRAEPMEAKALRDALTEAFGALDPDAQREWALSEVREEQLSLFLAANAPETLAKLLKELLPVYHTSGSWEAMRLLTHAAAMAQPPEDRHLPVVALLKGYGEH